LQVISTRGLRGALSLALVAVLMAACAPQPGTPPAATTQPAPATASAPTSQPAASAPTTTAPQATSKPAAATQAPAGQQTQSGQQATITLSSIAVGSDQLAPLMADFEKANPNIKVNVQYLPQATLGQATVTALQAGNAPDVMYTNGGTGQLHSVFALGKTGYLADLSQRPWAKDVPAVAHDLFWDGNKLYGLPVAFSLVGVVYNTSQFQQMGLQVPTTFAELVTLCGKIKAAGKIPMALAGQAPGLYAQAPAANTVYSTNPNWTEERVAGKATFAGTPGWQAALQQFVDLNNAGCFQPGASADTVVKAFNLLGTEEAVMFLAPSAAIGAIKGVNSNFPAAMFPLPGPTPEATRAVTQYNDSFSVNAKSANLDAAMKLVDFLAQPEQQQAYAKITGVISVPDSVTGKVSEMYSSFGPLLQQKKAVTLPSLVWPTPAVGTALTPGMQGLLTSQKSIADVLTDMDNAWNT
jgi:raffinose/stachyose/melibiose transport system substrate-binding protein